MRHRAGALWPSAAAQDESPASPESCIHEDGQGEASAAQVRDGPDAENVPCPLRQLPACLPLAWSSISEAITGPATPTTQGEGPPHRPP